MDIQHKKIGQRDEVYELNFACISGYSTGRKYNEQYLTPSCELCLVNIHSKIFMRQHFKQHITDVRTLILFITFNPLYLLSPTGFHCLCVGERLWQSVWKHHTRL